MSQLALDLGVPSTLVTEAVYARCLSAMQDARAAGQPRCWPGPSGRYEGDREEFIEQVRQALYASKICSYAQGFVQMQAAAAEHQWPLEFGSIALLWRGGCIIRAVFLERIKEAFDADPKLENLLLAPYFQQAVAAGPGGLAERGRTAVRLGIPTPAFSAALAYYDGYRSRAAAGQPAPGPARLLRRPHLQPHRQARACSTPIGSRCGSSPKRCSMGWGCRSEDWNSRRPRSASEGS